MSESNTVVRSVHDLGLAVWCGGSPMGAFGPNGAAVGATDRRERVTPSSLGWARWSPVAVTAIGAHLAGRITTADKAALTAVAMPGTASSASTARQVTRAAGQAAAPRRSAGPSLVAAAS
jgi:hypothetical protein